MRLRKSARSVSGKLMRNGRIAALSPLACCATAFIDLLLSAKPRRPTEPAAALAAAALQKKRRLIPRLLCMSNSLGTALDSERIQTTPTGEIRAGTEVRPYWTMVLLPNIHPPRNTFQRVG